MEILLGAWGTGIRADGYEEDSVWNSMGGGSFGRGLVLLASCQYEEKVGACWYMALLVTSIGRRKQCDYLNKVFIAWRIGLWRNEMW